MQKAIIILIVLFGTAACKPFGNHLTEQREENFNQDWEFTKSEKGNVHPSMFKKDGSIEWEQVSIPHTAAIEPLVIKAAQWQGDCFYRKFFTLPLDDKNKHLAIKFEGAMQVAQVYLNGELIHTNLGGYLPFYVEIYDHVKFGEENCLVVKLNNEDNLQVPPGKPIADLDFNIFSGVYRNVSLVVKDRLHISDVINRNKIAGGGVFVSFSEVEEKSALVNVKVDVENENAESKDVKVQLLLTLEDEIVSEVISLPQRINKNGNSEFKLNLKVEQPELWSPDSPVLYSLIVNVLDGDKLCDSQKERIGIRSIKFSAKEGFTINEKPIKLRGTNRHQEYPYVGYALSDNANYRDAWKIKKAGFNFVRLSHYPQTKSFLNACDELGLLVMDAIPGWQFFGDSVFQANAIMDVRKMVRRDRNHPSIILWEASLNESGMTKEFMQKAHQTVHEEYPGLDVYTCGWLDDVYDLYIPARQHGIPPYYWNNYSKNKPILIAEYGDWEYYAQNAGFNQKAFKNLSNEERNSRQLRAHGQKRLAQQALNYQEAHNNNLLGSAVGDANWLMFDYNRGYAPDLEASGIMDIFRLPKFAYYFYQSQVNIGESQQNEFAQPMLFIANYYNDPSFLDVKIYSNCDEVELFLDGKSIEKRKPDNDFNSLHLSHPPFTFNLDAFVPGELLAKGYVDGQVVASDSRRTPENAESVVLWIDESGKKLEKGCNDIVFLYAAVVDKFRTVIPNAQNRIKFIVEGDAEIIGTNPVRAEAGIATVLLKAGNTAGVIKIKAEAAGLASGNLSVE